MRPSRSLEAKQHVWAKPTAMMAATSMVCAANVIQRETPSKIILDTGANFDVLHENLFVRRGLKRAKAQSLDGISEVEFNELGDGLQSGSSLQIASLCKFIGETGCEMNFSKEGILLRDSSGTVIPVSLMNDIPYLPTRKYVELILPKLKAQTNKSEALQKKIGKLENYVESNTHGQADMPICRVGMRWDDEGWREHCKTHTPAVHGCEVCNAADGSCKPHREVKVKSRGTLALDISGPHKEGLLRKRYLLVAVYRPLDGDNPKAFPFVKSLRGRTALEVCEAVRSIILKIRILWEKEKAVLRVHSDAASEFLGSVMMTLGRELQFLNTHTGGRNPRSNGLAERYIGLIKQTARALLIQAGMSTRAWPFACEMAAHILRKKNECPKPVDLLGFGCPIQYFKGAQDRDSFAPKRQDGWYLCPHEATSTGGYVWTGTAVVYANDIRERKYGKDMPSRPKGLTCLMGASVGEDVGDTPSDIMEIQEQEGDNFMSEIFEEAVWDAPAWFEDQDEDELGRSATCLSSHRMEWSPVENLGPSAPPLFEGGEKQEPEATAEIIANKDVMVTTGSVRQNWLNAAEKELQSITDLNVFEEKSEESLQEVLREARRKGIAPEFLPSSMVWTIKPPKPPEYVKKHKARLCVAGNMSKLFGEAYTPTLDSCFAKMILKLAVVRSWTVAITDIRTAFLHAPLPEDRCVIVRPPAGLIRLGLVKKTDVWWLRKALYGLRECPRLWAQERDTKLKTMSWIVDGKKFCMVNNIVDPTMWSIKDENTDTLEGVVATYVDDVMFAGPAKVVKGGLKALNALWKCDEPVILPPNEKSTAVYLGIEIIRSDDGTIILTQNKYTSQLLQRLKVESTRAIGTTGENSWMVDPPDVSRLEPASLKDCQEALGGLLWLCTRTRMDIAFAVSKAASKASECPRTAWYMIKRILRYLNTNKELGINLTSSNADEEIRCFTDASWAPGNGRSQSGVVVCMGDTPLMWKSSKQSLTALSSAEAELIALTQGYQYAMGVEAVMACVGLDMKVTVLCDNAPTIDTVKGTTSWRSRYYCVRASRLRDAINTGVARIEFTPGIHQVADILTKYTDRHTTLHCLRLMNHVTIKGSNWHKLDPIRQKTTALSTDTIIDTQKGKDYDITPKHIVMTVYVNKEDNPLKWYNAKQDRLKRWPGSAPRPMCEATVRHCWRAGPFGVWTPPSEETANALIKIPGGGEGKWGVNRSGMKGIFTKNPRDEDGSWNDLETPKCPYCGKGRGDTFLILRLPNEKCLCKVEGSKRGMAKYLPMWPPGREHKSKLTRMDLADYDYRDPFPQPNTQKIPEQKVHGSSENQTE